MLTSLPIVPVNSEVENMAASHPNVILLLCSKETTVRSHFVQQIGEAVKDGLLDKRSHPFSRLYKHYSGINVKVTLITVRQ